VSNPFNKLPPQDLDAERGALGAVMLYDSRLDDIQSILTPEMFYLDSHAKIYRAMLRMRENQIGIDTATLSSELERAGLLAEVGGNKYLVQCIESIPHAAHAKFHAEQIRDRWTQRSVIYTCTELLRDAYNGQHNGVELSAKAVVSLEKISEQKSQGGRWFRDISMGAMDRHFSESPEGIPTGFADIDARTGGLKPAELTLIAGRPSMGKTALAGNIADNIAKAGGVVAFFSMEMSDEAVFDRTTLHPLKTCNNQLRSTVKEDPNRAQDVIHDIGRLPIWINDSASQSVASITAECRVVQRKHGLAVVVIDYLQLIEPEDKRAPREQQVGQISWRLKQLSKTLHVPVVCLSQLSRACESRPDKKPVMSDLRDSGQLEQNADNVWFPFRPHYYFPDQAKPEDVELAMPKNRGGQKGCVNLLWDGPTMTFKSFEEEIKSDNYFHDDTDGVY
jgi:replicative DNA helicase